MKRYLAVILCVIIIVIGLASCNNGENPEILSFIPENDDNSRSIADLCASKKNITVGFIGGSVTEGNTYSASFVEYLSETYPDNNFTQKNVGIGGTTSVFGVHRIDDQLVQYNPDIVFVEFSVNDSSDKVELYSKCMEGIIRKILRNDAGTLIVFVGTGNSTYVSNYENGTLPEIVAAHMAVAEHYNVPYINVGKELLTHISNSEEDDWYYYFNDGVHINSNGGAFYSDVMEQYLSDYKFDIKYKEEPLTSNDFENADLFDSRNYLTEPWVVRSNDMLGKISEYNHCLYSEEVGATLEFDFHGTLFGFYCRFDNDSGILEYSIDGGEWKQYSLYSDFYTIHGKELVGFADVEYGLENTKHHIVLRISEDKNPESRGNTISIGAFTFSGE